MLGNWTSGKNKTLGSCLLASSRALHMLGRHSPSYVLIPKYFFLFLWLYGGLNSGVYACKAALYCLSYITSPFWCGCVKGTACAPVCRHIYSLISRCH
jgi:hypothetical protein